METRSLNTYHGQVIKATEIAGSRLVIGAYPANTMVPAHSHDCAVFCVGLSGRCTETYSGKLREYEPATVQFLPAGHSHSLAFSSSDLRSFSLDVADDLIDNAREFSLRLDESIHARGGTLSSLMIRIYDEFTYWDDASPLSIQGLTMEMLAAVSRHAFSVADRRPQKWLGRAVDLIRTDFTEKLTLARIASTAGVHPVHLAREFRRHQGCTIGEYIRRLRIERACQSLIVSDESLATIAADAGFSDQSHFSRTFKTVMGMTAARYRANFQPK